MFRSIAADTPVLDMKTGEHFLKGKSFRYTIAHEDDIRAVYR
ncbi:MAG TPA: hypothetical protein VHE34_27330 [Puia sp.]|nr:hypothetical protein [Puia sp.]HVU98977.1 hypothetical protein [Puia sp.]